jgi:PGF-CTERM protein
MRYGRLLLTTFFVSLAVGFVVTPAGAATGHAQDTPGAVRACAAQSPADFADPAGTTDEVVGWVDGYWYDEPLSVTAAAELDEREFERFSARTAARVEAIRCLALEDPSVLEEIQVIDRESLTEERTQRRAEVSEAERQIANARFETMLTVDSRTDVIEQLTADDSARVGGFYDFVEDQVVIVSDDGDLSVDEGLLAHELLHVIQDQRFDIAQFDRPTVDRNNGILGLVEGEANLLQREYLDTCLVEWDCRSTRSGPAGEVPNWGIYLERRQPYADGPELIRTIRDREGWAGVNDRYERPPTSALHTAFPETYGDIEPSAPDVPDRSSDAWDRIVLEDVAFAEGPVTRETLGISSLTAMFGAPALETDGDQAVIPAENLTTVGSLGQRENYVHPETEGWRGDALYTYRNETGETATVWELAWASAEDATEFVASYLDLARLRGGESVAGPGETYTFEGTDYDLALSLTTSGDRVTVVTAPTVEQLTAVHGEVEGSEGVDYQPEDAADTDGHGFGVALALLALLVVSLARRR